MILKNAFWIVLLSAITTGYSAGTGRAQAAERPNILWITCEDISPNLGCYGD
jgi:N-sulfoglucosamine sulfohydrolase